MLNRLIQREKQSSNEMKAKFVYSILAGLGVSLEVASLSFCHEGSPGQLDAELQLKRDESQPKQGSEGWGGKYPS